MTCKKYLKQGKTPPMSAANNLRLLKLGKEEDICLTELENNLIAQNLIFQKVFQLPKSRWSATKDKLVNIPISKNDVINTLTNLPRTPSEAGLVEVKLKRKLGYKGYHRNEYINTENIFKALKVLKEKGHPDYQHFDDLITYENRCKSTDPTGYHLVFEDNET